jgi:hypothetical protein
MYAIFKRACLKTNGEDIISIFTIWLFLKLFVHWKMNDCYLIKIIPSQTS